MFFLCDGYVADILVPLIPNHDQSRQRASALSLNSDDSLSARSTRALWTNSPTHLNREQLELKCALVHCGCLSSQFDYVWWSNLFVGVEKLLCVYMYVKACLNLNKIYWHLCCLINRCTFISHLLSVAFLFSSYLHSEFSFCSGWTAACCDCDHNRCNSHIKSMHNDAFWQLLLHQMSI